MYYRLLLQDITWDNGKVIDFEETSGFNSEDEIDIEYEIKDYEDYNRGKDGCGNKIISYEYSIIEDHDEE